jgi:hypothetical protein
MSLEPTDPSIFDAVDAAKAIHAMADVAEQSGHQRARPPAEFIGNAVRELRTARAWLDANMTPFEAPDLKLLNASEDEIPVEALIDALRSTALELTQVHKLLRLRGPTTNVNRLRGKNG